MKASHSLQKPRSMRWGQRVWAAVSRWSQRSQWPLDTFCVRLRMLPLLPLYLRRLGLSEGLTTLYRFMQGSGGFTVYRSAKDPGLTIRQESADANVYQQVFILRDYRKVSDRNDMRVIVDAGAYVGFSSIYLAELYPHAFIYALEPEESNFQALQRNTRLYPNILAIQAALWNHEGQLEVHENKIGQGSVTVEEITGSPNHRRIPAITIKALMEQYRIPRVDLLKLDIEGAEAMVFDRDSCHQWLPLIQLLVIELHDHLLPGSDRSFFEAMTHYNFTVQYAGEHMILDFQHDHHARVPGKTIKRA